MNNAKSFGFMILVLMAVATVTSADGQSRIAIGARAYNTTADVYWRAVPDATGYFIYRSNNSGGPYVRLNAASVPDTLYRDGNLTNGTRYYYVVRAFFCDGDSVTSRQVAAVPSNLVATPVTDLKLTREHANVMLSWTPVSNAPSILAYRVSRRNDRGVEDWFMITSQTSVVIEGDADPLHPQSHTYAVDALDQRHLLNP